jgi:hypothetical protein
MAKNTARQRQTAEWPQWANDAAKQLSAVDDESGLRRLDDLLDEVKPEPYAIGVATGGRVANVRQLCAADVLDWASQRATERALLADMRPAIRHAVANDVDKRARWHALAEFVERFAIAGMLDVRDELRAAKAGNRSSDDGSTSPLPRPPVLQWLDALIEATRELLPIVGRAGSDQKQHVVALKHALDALKRGEAIDIAQHVKRAAIAINTADMVKPRQKSEHRRGTLDERALVLAKQWQCDPERCDRWTLDELAEALGTRRPNLIGTRKDKRPRCPLFAEFWHSLQVIRAKERMDRRPITEEMPQIALAKRSGRRSGTRAV